MLSLIREPLVKLFIAVCFGATGQILIKTGVKEIRELKGLAGLLGAFLHPKVFAGFALYGFSSLLYLKVLEKLDLSYAYPMIASSYVIVTILSYLFFKESIPPLRILGLSLVVVGVILIGRSAAPGMSPPLEPTTRP